MSIVKDLSLSPSGLQKICLLYTSGHLQPGEIKQPGQQEDQRDKEQPLPAYGQEGGPPGTPQRLEEHVGKDQHRPQGCLLYTSIFKNLIFFIFF